MRFNPGEKIPGFCRALPWKQGLSGGYLVLLGLALAGPGIAPVSHGLDPSWRLAIQWWRSFDYSWGRDLVFTYGPLGFVNAPVAAGPEGWITLARGLQVMIPVALVFLTAALYSRFLRSPLLAILLTTLVAGIIWAGDFPYKWAFALTPLLAARLITDARHEHPWAVLQGLLTAFLLLSIPGPGIIAGAILLISLAGLGLQRRFLAAALACIVFLCAFLGGWRLLAGPHPDLLRYLTAAWHFAQGYDEAMARPYRFYYDTLPILLRAACFGLLGLGVGGGLLVKRWRRTPPEGDANRCVPLRCTHPAIVIARSASSSDAAISPAPPSRCVPLRCTHPAIVIARSASSSDATISPAPPSRCVPLRCTHPTWALFALLPVGCYAFGVWKHAITRHPQAGAYLLPAIAVLLLIWASAAPEEKRKAAGRYAFTGFLALLIACNSVDCVIRHGSIKELPLAAGRLLTQAAPQGLRALDPRDTLARLFAPLPKPANESAIPASQARRIQDGTVDIYPWDISDLFLSDLHWRPRPVIQSYCTWDPWLDAWNADHIKASGADWVIFNAYAMDRRYRFTNEPLSLAALRRCYDPISQEENSLLLKRRAETKGDAESASVVRPCRLGDWVSLPDQEGLYCYPQLEKTFWGKLATFFYKDIGMNLCLETAAGERYTYRAVSSNLTSGLYVSRLLTTTDHFAAWFEGGAALEQLPKITRIQITPWYPSFYHAETRLRFSYPASPSLRKISQ